MPSILAVHSHWTIMSDYSLLPSMCVFVYVSRAQSPKQQLQSAIAVEYCTVQDRVVSLGPMPKLYVPRIVTRIWVRVPKNYQKTKSPAVVKIADSTSCQWPSSSSKVNDFYLMWQGVCRSLLVIINNLRPISHRFRIRQITHIFLPPLFNPKVENVPVALHHLDSVRTFGCVRQAEHFSESYFKAMFSFYWISELLISVTFYTYLANIVFVRPGL